MNSLNKSSSKRFKFDPESKTYFLGETIMNATALIKGNAINAGDFIRFDRVSKNKPIKQQRLLISKNASYPSTSHDLKPLMKANKTVRVVRSLDSIEIGRLSSECANFVSSLIDYDIVRLDSSHS